MTNETVDEPKPDADERQRYDGREASVDSIILPQVDDGDLSQDTEWCLVELNGRKERVRFHDYGRIFEVPGLYERIFYDILDCDSPRRVIGMLGEIVNDNGDDAGALRVLDVGAGNGIVAEELLALGAEHIVGLDILEEAKRAAHRDRPEVYDEYLVADLTDLPEDAERSLDAAAFNCMVTVATLGFNDIPPEAFAAAAEFIETPGWLAFNLKEDFLGEREDTGFGRLIHSLQDAGIIEIHAHRRYRHRLSICGEPLHYVALVARKLDDIPDRLVDEASACGSASA